MISRAALRRRSRRSAPRGPRTLTTFAKAGGVIVALDGAGGQGGMPQLLTSAPAPRSGGPPVDPRGLAREHRRAGRPDRHARGQPLRRRSTVGHVPVERTERRQRRLRRRADRRRRPGDRWSCTRSWAVSSLSGLAPPRRRARRRRGSRAARGKVGEHAAERIREDGDVRATSGRDVGDLLDLACGHACSRSGDRTRPRALPEEANGASTSHLREQRHRRVSTQPSTATRRAASLERTLSARMPPVGVAACAAVTDDDDARAIELRAPPSAVSVASRKSARSKRGHIDGGAGRVTRVGRRGEDERLDLPAATSESTIGGGRRRGTEPGCMTRRRSCREGTRRRAARRPLRRRGDVGEPSVRVARVEKPPLPIRKDERVEPLAASAART